MKTEQPLPLLLALTRAIKMLEELSELLGADVGLGVDQKKLQQLRDARDAEIARLKKDEEDRALVREASLQRRVQAARSIA